VNGRKTFLLIGWAQNRLSPYPQPHECSSHIDTDYRKPFQHLVFKRSLTLKFPTHTVKKKIKVVPVLNQLSITPWRRMGEWMYIDPHFLDLGTSWEWSVSCPGRFTPRERAPGTHWIGGWVDPRTVLDMEKRKFLALPGLELRPLLSRPARRYYTCIECFPQAYYTLCCTHVNFDSDVLTPLYVRTSWIVKLLVKYFYWSFISSSADFQEDSDNLKRQVLSTENNILRADSHGRSLSEW
jgi:hypothetical protein